MCESKTKCRSSRGSAAAAAVVVTVDKRLLASQVKQLSSLTSCPFTPPSCQSAARLHRSICFKPSILSLFSSPFQSPHSILTVGDADRFNLLPLRHWRPSCRHVVLVSCSFLLKCLLVSRGVLFWERQHLHTGHLLTGCSRGRGERFRKGWGYLEMH